MVAVPAAIVFVNNDLTDNVQARLIRQLHISEVISGETFDSRVDSDSEYVNKIKQLNQRVMVVRSFATINNRDLADVLIFVKNGLAAVETDKVGPPGITFEVLDLYWGKLGIYI